MKDPWYFLFTLYFPDYEPDPEDVIERRKKEVAQLYNIYGSHLLDIVKGWEDWEIELINECIRKDLIVSIDGLF